MQDFVGALNFGFGRGGFPRLARAGGSGATLRLHFLNEFLAPRRRHVATASAFGAGFATERKAARHVAFALTDRAFSECRLPHHPARQSRAPIFAWSKATSIGGYLHSPGCKPDDWPRRARVPRLSLTLAKVMLRPPVASSINLSSCAPVVTTRAWRSCVWSCTFFSAAW